MRLRVALITGSVYCLAPHALVAYQWRSLRPLPDECPSVGRRLRDG